MRASMNFTSMVLLLLLSSLHLAGVEGKHQAQRNVTGYEANEAVLQRSPPLGRERLKPLQQGPGVSQRQRNLHHYGGRAGKGRGKGMSRSRSKGKGKGGRGRRQRNYYRFDDDYYYDDDAGGYYYVEPARRDRHREQGNGGNGGGGTVYYVQRVPGPSPVQAARPEDPLAGPYRGTGIGRINRRNRPARGGSRQGNRFPAGFRPDMIRTSVSTTTTDTVVTTENSTTVIGGTTAPGATPVPGTPTAPGVTPVPGTTTAPGATAAPLAPGATAAPSIAATDLLVRSTFALTYFTGQPTDVDRDLTPEEYAELASLMDEFYTDNFSADPTFSADFIDYMTDITSMTYTAGGTPHIFMDFDANFRFRPDTAITTAQILLEMEGLDYESFIRDYLMRNPPLNQLDAVQAVQFEASVEPVVV